MAALFHFHQKVDHQVIGKHVCSLLGKVLDVKGYWETQHSGGSPGKSTHATHFITEFHTWWPDKCIEQKVSCYPRAWNAWLIKVVSLPKTTAKPISTNRSQINRLIHKKHHRWTTVSKTPCILTNYKAYQPCCCGSTRHFYRRFQLQKSCSGSLEHFQGYPMLPREESSIQKELQSNYILNTVSEHWEVPQGQKTHTAVFFFFNLENNFPLFITLYRFFC